MAKVKARLRGGGEIEQHDAAIDETGAIWCDRRGAAIDDWRGSIVKLELNLWSSDWNSGFTDEVSSSSLFAIWAFSLSLWKCFEVKIGIENNFRGQSLILYDQMKIISGKLYFQSQPNSLFYGK